MIISAFPGMGKTFASKKFEDIAVDLESSAYQWYDYDFEHVEQRKGKTTEKKILWPRNYFDDVVSSNIKFPFVFISSNPIILDMLSVHGVKFVTVTPKISDKKDYLDSYIKRGDPEEFVNKISDNFDSCIKSLDNNENALCHVKLEHGKHISDIITYLWK